MKSKVLFAIGVICFFGYLGWYSPAFSSSPQQDTSLPCPEGTIEKRNISKYGQESAWCETKAGIRHGLFRQWYKNGQLQYEKSYKNGKLCGIEHHFWDNGKMYSETYYENDKTNGIEKWFYKNGQIRQQGLKKNGQMVGEWTFWCKDGKVALKKDCTHRHACIEKDLGILIPEACGEGNYKN